MRSWSTRASSAVSGPAAGVGVAQGGRGVVRRRDEVPPGRLGQRAQQRDGEVVAQPRHLPVEPVGGDPVEHRDGHVDGDPVGGLAGGELVRDVELEVALAPRGRVVGGRDALAAVGRQVGLGEVEQLGPAPALTAPPPVEVPLGDHVGRDPAVVEREHHLVVDDDVAPAGALLELGDPGEGALVAPPELVVGLPVPLDEGRAEEDLARDHRVDAGVLDGAVGDERHAVERHPLGGDGGPGVAAPPRLAHGAGDDVRPGLLGPLRVDGGDRAGPQPRRLDELGGDDVLGPAPEEGRARADAEAGTAGPEVLAPHLVTDPDVREQAGEQGAVDGVPVGVGVLRGGRHVGVDPGLAGGPAELGVQVLPLADAQVVQVLVLAHAAERAVREVLLLRLEVAPQGEQ